MRVRWHMNTFKRINQLDQVYQVKDGDFLIVDVNGYSESSKVAKSDLLQEYLTKPPNDKVTKNWVWAVKGGTWYRIYPDDYVFEAPYDGKIYVRVNGKWVAVTGVSGDMLQSIYDTQGRATDVFQFILDRMEKENYISETLFDESIIYEGGVATIEYGLEGSLNTLVIEGVSEAEPFFGTQSFDYPIDSFNGIGQVQIVTSHRDLIQNRTLVIGNYDHDDEGTAVHTQESTWVNPGDTYSLDNLSGSTMFESINVVYVDRYNQVQGAPAAARFDILTNSFTVPADVHFVGLELYIKSNVETTLETIQGVFNEIIIPKLVDGKYSDTIDAGASISLYGLWNVRDTYDIISGDIRKFIRFTTLNDPTAWTLAGAPFLNQSTTAAFVFPSLVTTENLQATTINCEADVFAGRSYNDLYSDDIEGIALYNDNFYIRIDLSRFSKEVVPTPAGLLIDFKEFITNYGAIRLLYNSNVLSEDNTTPIPVNQYNSVTHIRIIPLGGA